MGDFNAFLLKYETNTNHADVLNQIHASPQLQHIKSPTCVTPRTNTLIDNIFSTDTYTEVISANIMTSITGRLSQFCLFPLTQTNRDKKKEIYKHSCKHFKAENFLNDQNIDWNQVLNIEKKLIDKSFDKFLNIFQLLSDTYTSKKTLQCYTKCFIQTMETKTKKFQESKIHNKKKNYDEFNRYKNYIDILTRKNK